MGKFFIIGAQKAGTTALWQYLRKHPEINMPASKEAPFFASREMREKGWDWYHNEYFVQKQGALIEGTSTPQYMCHPDSAQHIFNKFPNAKLIAIFRDPVHRAVSHYKMAVRWGHEKRSFDIAINEQLQPEALATSRTIELDNMAPGDHKNMYVVWGEYERIMRGYFDVFPRSQLLVLAQAELFSERRETIKKVLKFLEINHTFLPTNLEEEFHVSSEQSGYRLFHRLLENSAIRKVGRVVLPRRQRKAINFWLATKNGKKAKRILVTKDIYEKLQNHYSQDINWVNEHVTLAIDCEESVVEDVLM